MRQSLGMVEAKGLATAIEAADAMVKSANVLLLGIESSRGGGMHVVKVLGDVGAVKAACEAGSAACDKGNGVQSVRVIARPSEGILPYIYNTQTKGFDPETIEDKYRPEAYWHIPTFGDQFHPAAGTKETMPDKAAKAEE
jgi:ethanolamine utilization protein EutM